MPKIKQDIINNYNSFSSALPGKLKDNIHTLTQSDLLLKSYNRISCFNSLKRDFVEISYSREAKRFFDEAHNDLLVSHIQASIGSWRSALQSLRSFIENVASSVYFKDHPIELINWHSDSFRISPRELREYTHVHPNIKKLLPDYDPKVILDSEYSTLSKAVHSSNNLFRMSIDDGSTLIANPDLAELGKWHTRQSKACDVCAVITIASSPEYLDGAKLPALRSALNFVLGKKSKIALKKHYSISIHD